MCLTFSSPITALANSNNTQVVKAQVNSSDKEKLLLDKQSEIDKYVFEKHAKDIEEKGFKVTHTGQAKGYVEVGITPFNKKNADYIYSLFGKELVKVVEGQQAQLMDEAISTTSAKVNEPVKANSTNPITYALIIVFATGVIALMVHRKKSTR